MLWRIHRQLVFYLQVGSGTSQQMGTWIQNVGAVDLMTVLAPTALVQTATTLPCISLGLGCTDTCRKKVKSGLAAILSTEPRGRGQGRRLIALEEIVGGTCRFRGARSCRW